MNKCIGWGVLLLGAWAGQVPASMTPLRDCTTIVSSLERLACFDQAAGTPLLAPPVQAKPFVDAASPLIALLHANEAQRQAQSVGFLMSIDTEHTGVPLQRVMISAPALVEQEPRPYLMISCQSNISRLQLLMGQPITRHSVKVQLLLDDQAVSQKRPWRVLEAGRVIDAGRGLPAVDVIKRLVNGGRIQVRSDEPQLDGLVFDAEGLGLLIEEERKACHW
jgi:type VI secretion system protein VasI